MINNILYREKIHALLNDEKELLYLVTQGSWEAYSKLFKHYLPKLAQYIFPLANESKEDTEEIIQEVFLKIWEKRESLISIRSFDTYLFRMARNKLIDLIRKRKSIANCEVRFIRLQSGLHTEQAYDNIIYSEYKQIAEKVIHSLSPRLRTVFLMSNEEELSLDEIALKLAISKSVVKKRLYLANGIVKNVLRDKMGWVGIISFVLWSGKFIQYFLF